MRFSNRLRDKAAPIWEQEHQHPFVAGIGDGTLPIAIFQYYMRQDYLFLIDYSKVFALAVARAHDLAVMGKFSALLHATLQTEMDLHRAYAREFGLSTKELEETPMAPTTYAYTRHLLYTAETGSFPDLVAALLPCMWGYAEIGTYLAQQKKCPPESLYQKWIAIYASAEFVALAEWLRELLDTLAIDLPETALQRLETLFLLSSRYEYMFWEMSYRQETWPV
jgi:thiaminase/transcriptional activator TenA